MCRLTCPCHSPRQLWFSCTHCALDGGMAAAVTRRGRHFTYLRKQSSCQVLYMVELETATTKREEGTLLSLLERAAGWVRVSAGPRCPCAALLPW